MSEKSTAANMLDAAKAKVNEVADNAKAAAKDLAADLGNDPIKKTVNRAEAAADRVKADLHGAQAQHSFEKGKAEATDGDGH